MYINKTKTKQKNQIDCSITRAQVVQTFTASCVLQLYKNKTKKTGCIHLLNWVGKECPTAVANHNPL